MIELSGNKRDWCLCHAIMMMYLFILIISKKKVFWESKILKIWNKDEVIVKYRWSFGKILSLFFKRTHQLLE